MKSAEHRNTLQSKRLQLLIRANAPGGCRVFSLGDACQCALCDVDRLQLVVTRAAAVLEAITEADQDMGTGDRTTCENEAIEALRVSLGSVLFEESGPTSR